MPSALVQLCSGVNDGHEQALHELSPAKLRHHGFRAVGPAVCG
ncbi:MAG: hypothetical protein ACFFBD_13450 [Candidatus Hodarchaeota archaeon]